MAYRNTFEKKGGRKGCRIKGKRGKASPAGGVSKLLSKKKEGSPVGKKAFRKEIRSPNAKRKRKRNLPPVKPVKRCRSLSKKKKEEKKR